MFCYTRATGSKQFSTCKPKVLNLGSTKNHRGTFKNITCPPVAFLWLVFNVPCFQTTGEKLREFPVCSWKTVEKTTFSLSHQTPAGSSKPSAHCPHSLHLSSLTASGPFPSALTGSAALVNNAHCLSSFHVSIRFASHVSWGTLPGQESQWYPRTASPGETSDPEAAPAHNRLLPVLCRAASESWG